MTLIAAWKLGESLDHTGKFLKSAEIVGPDIPDEIRSDLIYAISEFQNDSADGRILAPLPL